MEYEFKTDTEGVITVSEKGKGGLVAIIRRDPESRKHLVYLCKEAASEDIAKLIQPGFSMPKDFEGKKEE